ncbi:MAG: cobalamin-dependent protein [Rhodovibrio sp.]|nr:cobalamin-dependent protein [Rhodovibrio sp.]
MNGWSSHYLGANTPKAAIHKAVRQVQPEVLALSVTTPYRTWRLADVIADLRQDPETAGVKVLVGGYPFHVSPSLAQWIGADGTARNAEDAVRLAGDFARVCAGARGSLHSHEGGFLVPGPLTWAGLPVRSYGRSGLYAALPLPSGVLRHARQASGCSG